MNWIEQALDGDLDAVEPAAFGPLRPRYGRDFTQGVSVRTEHLPTRIRYGAARKTRADLSWATDFYTVSDRFRAVVEAFEPGLHQFHPVNYLSKRKVFLEKRYILNVCRRIDAADEDRSTVLRHKKRLGYYWNNPGTEPGDLVFDRRRIGDAHLWLDPATFGRPATMLSALLAEAMAAATLTGILFRPFRLLQTPSA